MASGTYDKGIIASVIMAKVFMTKVLWQMKLSRCATTLHIMISLWFKGFTLPCKNLKEFCQLLLKNQS